MEKDVEVFFKIIRYVFLGMVILHIHYNRYSIRDFIQKIWFGPELHYMRKSVRYAKKGWRTYDERKEAVQNLKRNYKLSKKEIIWCLGAINDTKKLEDLHIELLQMLKDKGFFKKTVHPVFDFFKHLEGHEFRKLQNIAWH